MKSVSASRVRNQDKTVLREGGKTNRVISMLREYICEQLGHPTLDSVWVTINQGTDTENSSVTLTNSGIIDWRLSVGKGGRT